MVTVDILRAIAMTLPQTEEKPHHGFPSFRVGGKIFVTVPDDLAANIMLEPDDIRAAVASNAGSCEELWWGKTLAAVRVTLAAIDEEVLASLVVDAWRRRAPAKVRSAFDARSQP